ncbi:MAG TPA: inositol monophosphatase family protein [Dongiaceae bacterium]|jgi:myo-inositol-1(or 4)-monophosphatase|nr:inositol monophosphatase family protein [Dongiaceae bacterium]
MPALTPILTVMMKAAQKAARGLRRDFGEVENLQVTQKGPADFVTSADVRTERLLQEELQKARPDNGFLMEEGGAIAGQEGKPTWIIDPIDGTTNFLHGIPHFAISIALQKDKEIVAGLIFDPIKDEAFYAAKGFGAFCNDRRLRVSARKNLHEALFATGIPFRGHGDPVRFQQQLDKAVKETAGVRRFGAASLDLAYVAAGRVEGYWEEFLSPWDIAAGILLVREAGGVVTDFAGGDNMLTNGAVLASNGALAPAFRKLIAP